MTIQTMRNPERQQGGGSRRLVWIVFALCVLSTGFFCAAGSAASLSVGDGGYATIADALSSAAPGDTILIESGTYDESLVITVPVTVTGVDDSVDDGDVDYHIVTARATSSDTKYNDVGPSDVSVTNTDDDGAGITVHPISGLTTTEAGGTATFTIVLDSEPTAQDRKGVG